MKIGTLLVAALAATGVAGSASALDVQLSQSSIPTPGLAGFNTWTVTATNLDPEPINGFDIFVEADSVNQVNPFGLPTIFEDNNGVFVAVGALPLQDTQFLFNAGTETLLIPVQSESSTGIRAAWVTTNAVAAITRDFLQVVLPEDATALLTGTLAVGTGEEFDVNFTIGQVGTPIPVPAAALLGLPALVGGIAARRRLSA